MLIPVTHSTQCVAECAKCEFSGQANTTLVQARSLVFHHPIQYGRPNYITHEPGFGPCSCVQRLFDTLANHCTHNTRPHCHVDWRMGIHWLCNIGYGPMRNHIFPTQRLVPYSRTDTGKWGNSHAKKISLQKRARLLPMP